MSKSVISCLVILHMLFMCPGCSWVDDDRSDCPTGCWLKLTYTYNMLNVDAASTQLKEATIFILDKEENCVAKEEIDSLTLHQNNCLIRLPSLPEAEYTVLVWSGLTDGHYECTPATLKLLRNEAGEHQERLAGLFHGRLDGLRIDEKYQIIEVPLVKNTNTLSCKLQSSVGATMRSNDFRLELTARNGLMDHKNMPADTTRICYLPFMQNTVGIEGFQVVQAGMNTLRLFENDDTRLSLIYTPSGQAVFSLPLCQYLLLSGQVHAANMEAQEYLDRQDQYNLLFFLTPTDNPQLPYLCMQMEVNGWKIRLNDGVLGDK